MTRGEACVLGLIRAKRRTKRLVAIKMVGPIPDARNFNVEQHSTIYRGRFQRLHSRERSAPAMRHAIFLINVFLHFLPFLFVRVFFSSGTFTVLVTFQISTREKVILEVYLIDRHNDFKPCSTPMMKYLVECEDDFQIKEL